MGRLFKEEGPVKGVAGQVRWGGACWGRSQTCTQPPGALAQANPGHSPLLTARRCSAFYNLPTEHASLRKICHRDVCRCAEGEVMGLRRAGTARLGVQELFITSWAPSGLSLSRERERQRDSKTETKRDREKETQRQRMTHTLRHSPRSGESETQTRRDTQMRETEKKKTKRRDRGGESTLQIRKARPRDPAAAAWGRMAVRWEEGPCASAARTAAPLPQPSRTVPIPKGQRPPAAGAAPGSSL